MSWLSAVDMLSRLWGVWLDVRDSEPSKLVHRRAATTGPMGGGSPCCLGYSSAGLGDPGPFYVALDHMRCDVGIGRGGGLRTSIAD